MRTVAAGQRWWSTAFPQIVDAAGPIVVTAVVLLAASGNNAGGLKQLDLLGAGLIVVSNLPTAFRRRAPLVTLLVCCAGMAAFAATGYWEALNVMGSLLALYTVAARYPPTTSIPAAALQVATAVSAAFVTGAVTFWIVTMLTPQFSSTAWILGNRARILARHKEKPTTLLDHSSTHGTGRTIIEERVRLARELHGIVTHHLSSIARRAGLARYSFYTDPETAYAAVRSIGDASGQALEDLRRLLTLLLDPTRPDAAELVGVALGVDRLSWLVDNLTASGTPITLTVTGVTRRLTPGVDLCLYRIVQTSLSTAHSGAAVTVDYHPTRVVVRITDNEPSPTHPDTPDLTNLREWAELYGGTLIIRASPQHGRQVVLTLPIADPADT
ncbi:sensor histidine kinase [Nocardia sp. NPDC052316]|uniref:sensor histidine kinase n=1 Tax=Nocardia sp. NPDC052316 TaxID=3364329 RepID=UPI0037C9A32E